MKRGFWIAGGLGLVAVIVVLFLLLSGGQERPATVIEAVNTVDAHLRPKDDWQPAAAGMAIYGGGQVRTGTASSARLELLEGTVRLSAESLFTVKVSAVRQGELMTTLFLQEGRLWAHLTASQPHQFTVEAGSAVAAVRDTHFSVKVADGETLLSVAEGQVVLTAQEQSVTVSADEQTTVEPGQPPALPEPMSEEERVLWATEGERPELAPPTPTLTPTPIPAPTLTPTATPVKVEMWVDVYGALAGPTGDPASRDPWTKLEARVQSHNAAQVMVETPRGEVVVVPSYGDIFGQERRFHRDVQGLPQAGGSYTFIALDAEGAPMPGAVASDVYIGGYEPDPPTNLQAEAVETGLLVTWVPSPVIPGAFDPSRSPTLGYYQIVLHQEGGGMVYGWNYSGRPLPETSHLIPYRRQDFGPGDLGLALEEMDDGVYFLSLDSFSAAPVGTAGQGLECSANDPGENLRIVIQGGQVRISEKGRLLFDCETPPLVCLQLGSGKAVPLDNSSGLYFRMPAWSPDGEKIVVTGNPDGDPHRNLPNALYIMNLDGSGLTQVTQDQRNDIMPAWSPDGTSIAYHSSGDLYRIKPDGSDAEALVAGQGCTANPAWSPDSQRIAFLFNPAGCSSEFPWNTEVWTINYDGSGRALLARAGPEEGAEDIIWSPDGQVVYYRTRTESGPSNWFGVAVDGSSQPQPAQEPPYWWRHNYWPQWQE